MAIPNEAAYQKSIRDDTSLRIAETGGSDLPDVTIEDDGKVLKVVDGAWAAAEESTGNSILSVSYNTNGSTTTCNKTYAEIRSALITGDCLFYLTSPLFTGIKLYCDYITEETDSLRVNFSYWHYDQSSGTYGTDHYIITHTENEIIVSI